MTLVRFLFIAVLLSVPSFAQEDAPLQWYKGNTHTHTLNSDGDSTPDEVARWYREHGYHFLVMTDHNFLTPVDGLNALHGAAEKFLVIRGEEVSDKLGSTQIHVNGLDVSRQIEPQGGETVLEILQRNIDAIREADGVPHVNHPNFNWAITADELRQLERTRLFEIFNGHPQVNNQGGPGRPSLEQMWDAVLSSGLLLHGIAVDDAHHFKRWGDPWASTPGRGWIFVRARQLRTDQILSAIERGDFYASTGVVLDDYEAGPEEIRISIRAAGEAAYTTRFIGRGGKVLLETGENPAVYRVRGDEGYVRGRVADSNGRLAWTQPRFIAPDSD